MILKCSEKGCNNNTLSTFIIFIDDNQFDNIQEAIFLIKKELRKANRSDRWNNSTDCCIHVMNKLGIKYQEVDNFIDFCING